MGKLKQIFWVLSIGIVCRIILILCVTPKLQSKYYGPFLASLDGNVDPWSRWLAHGGAPEAFPYGLAMLTIHIPQLLFIKALKMLHYDSQFLLTASFLFLIMVCELLIVRIMILRKVPISLIAFFYLNPLFIYLNYVQGANDILPAALLVVSAHFLCTKKGRLAGLFFGLAIGMKYSLALALPFFALYSYDNPRSRNQLRAFSQSLCLAIVICYAPIIYSGSFRKMLLSTSEMDSLLGFAVQFGNYRISIFPVVYIFLLYWLWKAGRTSIETLLIFSGTAFIAISISNPTTPGWLLWGLPLILLIMQPVTTSYIVLNCVFMFTYSIFIIATNYGFNNVYWISILHTNLINTSLTLAIAIGMVLVISSLRHSLQIGDLYSFGKSPLVISIAGDSGVGKDTLSSIIQEAFGAVHVTEICGDDFHRFERQHPVWQKTTHLDPFVNNLKLWEKNLRLARERKEFRQNIYDHELGTFKESTIKPKADLVISQGLHALYPNFDSLSDLKIYIWMDEELRIANKIARDVTLRGKSHDQVMDSIVSRMNDSYSFIQPQKENADLVIEIASNSPSGIEILLTSKNPSFAPKLFEILEEFEVLGKSFSISESGTQKVGIASDGFMGVTALQVLESKLMNFNQVFERKPEIQDGYQGILAMIVFLAIDWEKSLR